MMPQRQIKQGLPKVNRPNKAQAAKDFQQQLVVGQMRGELERSQVALLDQQQKYRNLAIYGGVGVLTLIGGYFAFRYFRSKKTEA